MLSVTVGAATLLAKGLESLGRSTGAIRTSAEENHVVCVFYLSGTYGVRVVISAVGDLVFGSAGEPGEVAGSVPGCSELLGRHLKSRGKDRSGGLGGCLWTASSTELGGGSAVKRRGCVEAFGRFAVAGEVPGRGSPFFRMARSGSPVRRVLADSEGCDRCLWLGLGAPHTSDGRSGLGVFGVRG